MLPNSNFLLKQYLNFILKSETLRMHNEISVRVNVETQWN